MLNKIFIEGYEYIHRNIRIDRGHDYNLPNSITYFHLTSKPIDEISSELLLQGGSLNNLNLIGKNYVRRKESC
jgi:hypothetical protein